MTSSKENELLLGFIQWNSKLQRQLGSALSVHGLGLSEFLVLQALNAAPNGSMRRIDLAERIGLSASGVTRLLNPMEKVGLVGKEASERDARVSLVRLSSAGARILEEATVSVDHVAKSMFGPLDDEQKKQLGTLVG